MTSKAPSPRSRPSSVTGMRASATGPTWPSMDAKCVICCEATEGLVATYDRDPRQPPVRDPRARRRRRARRGDARRARPRHRAAAGRPHRRRAPGRRAAPGGRPHDRRVLRLDRACARWSAAAREVVAGGGRMAVAVLEDSAVARLFALAGAHELMPVHHGLEPPWRRSHRAALSTSAVLLALGAAVMHAAWTLLLARAPDTEAATAAALAIAVRGVRAVRGAELGRRGEARAVPRALGGLRARLLRDARARAALGRGRARLPALARGRAGAGAGWSASSRSAPHVGAAAGGRASA